MATNSLPSNLGDLLKLGNKMEGGLTEFGQTLKITQITAASLLAEITAVTTTQTTYNLARDARQTASTTCTDYHAQIVEWLTKARATLVPYLGRSWSAAWAAAGFTDHSTAVPPYVGDQLNLLSLLSAFLGENPNYEDPEIGITGAAGTALQKASVAADKALALANTAANTKKDARDTTLEDLKGSMRMLIRILNELLAADDPRWEAFGLNMPDSDTTPATPANLTVNIADGPVLMAACDAVPLVSRYRWRIKVVGVDADYRLAASTKSPLAQLDKVLPGQTVELIVQAANQTSQSLPSASVLVTLPTLAERTQPVKAAAPTHEESSVKGYTDISAPGTNGNGSARSLRGSGAKSVGH